MKFFGENDFSILIMNFYLFYKWMIFFSKYCNINLVFEQQNNKYFLLFC